MIIIIITTYGYTRVHIGLYSGRSLLRGVRAPGRVPWGTPGSAVYGCKAG